MIKIFNKLELKKRRTELRATMPAPEIVLWKKIKNKQVQGVKFRRQFSIGNYIVDFYSPQTKLAIEIDGDSHYVGNAQEYDLERQKYIESLGIEVIRFSNYEIIHNLNGVLITLDFLLRNK